MKKLTTSQQRELYKKYKETRLNEANNVLALYKTGTYTAPEKSELILSATTDIMNFVSIFEDRIIEEARKELAQLSIY